MQRPVRAMVLCAVVLLGLVAPAHAPSVQAQSTPPIDVATDLAPLLPTLVGAPAGLTIAEDGSRSAHEIAQTFPDPADAAQQLAFWGWQGNAYRTFVARPTGSSTTPIRLEVSLHRFAWPTGAAWALPYFSHGRAVALDQAEASPIFMRPDEAAVTGLNEATRYVRAGTLLVRVTAVMPPDKANAGVLAVAVATATAQSVLEGAGETWPAWDSR